MKRLINVATLVTLDVGFQGDKMMEECDRHEVKDDESDDSASLMSITRCRRFDYVH
jgi:hypothetical protein